jgi:hypothetical protein
LEVSDFPLTIGWALKEVQKYGKKGGGKHMKKRIILILEQCFLAGNIDKSCRMNAQEMLNMLKLKVEEGELENSDLPKLPTIQGWITRYTAQLRERNAQTTLGVENINN